MSSSTKSPLSEQYNHPFGHLFGKRVNLHADLDKLIFRAEEEDKVMLRELCQWNHLMNHVYGAEMRRDLRQRYMTTEQHQGSEGEYWDKIIYQQFAVLKYFYQDRYEKYHELARAYDVSTTNLEMMERILKNEVEEMLIKGEEDEYTKS